MFKQMHFSDIQRGNEFINEHLGEALHDFIADIYQIANDWCVDADKTLITIQLLPAGSNAPVMIVVYK